MTVTELRACKQRGERFAMLTAYDFTTASALDCAGIPVLLVGDTLGIFVQGHSTTLPVTLEAMIYHCEMVSRAVKQALVVGDMPFGTYNSVTSGVDNAVRIMKAGGAHAVKFEGPKLELTRQLTDLGVPVMGHLGLTPQAYHQLGGNKVQARTRDAADRLVEDAQALEEAGAFALVLEAVPTEAARRVTAALGIPTIGIGAGPYCDGQVLVSTEMLGLKGGESPRFAKRYAELRGAIVDAAAAFATEVRSGAYPDATHSYNWALKESA
ncbi:MAG TPA: 3-methyl-2-oxobutanoate hydroxymethyltransferase [Chloroflexota bacterium]|nr:3-methyl-2-oxobutanoate hydroxymethyltransferase [Chloroflexota bacterium]